MIEKTNGVAYVSDNPSIYMYSMCTSTESFDYFFKINPKSLTEGFVMPRFDIRDSESTWIRGRFLDS